MGNGKNGRWKANTRYIAETMARLYKEKIKYCLINEQECFIRFKATSAQREWL
jgi:hypothetical protein